MTTADIVYQRLQKMPESLVNEILDFTEYLANKYQETDKLQTRPTKRNETLFKLAGIAQGTGEPNEIQSTETQAVSCLELALAHNLVGCIKNAPEDLSINKIC